MRHLRNRIHPVVAWVVSWEPAVSALLLAMRKGVFATDYGDDSDCVSDASRLDPPKAASGCAGDGHRIPSLKITGIRGLKSFR